MLRVTVLRGLSIKQFAHGVQATRCRKQSSRETTMALQASRQRTQVQRGNFAIQQEVNQAFGARQRAFAHGRRAMERAAEDLMYHREIRAHRRAGTAGQVRVTAKDRAAEMAMARQLLHMHETTRRAMKKTRTQRTESFRAAKQWSRTR